MAAVEEAVLGVLLVVDEELVALALRTFLLQISVFRGCPRSHKHKLWINAKNSVVEICSLLCLRYSSRASHHVLSNVTFTLHAI